MNRDEIALKVFDAYLHNNELRYDLNRGVALHKGGMTHETVALIFKIADALVNYAEGGPPQEA